MTTKIYLGRVRNGVTNLLSDEPVYLSKHTWDCGWYWSLGYVGNMKTHCHFEGQFLTGSALEASEVFSTTHITNAEWWVLRDLFIQAYALQKAAEIYRYGGHQTTKTGLTDMLHSPEKAKALNADLGRLLDTLWDYASIAVAPKVDTSIETIT